MCVVAYCSCIGVLKKISVLGPDFKTSHPVSGGGEEKVETVRQHLLYLPKKWKGNATEEKPLPLQGILIF